MRSRGIDEGAFVEIVAASRDGSQRWLRQYRAFAYNLPRGSAAGNMPEMNVLLGPADYSTQSDSRSRSTSAPGSRPRDPRAKSTPPAGG